MSCCGLNLWPMTLKVCGTAGITWSKSVRNLSEIEQSPAELLITLQIFAHVMSCGDLDLWPLKLELLQHFGCHAFKLYKIWAKSNNPRLSYWLFSTFSSCNFRDGASVQRHWKNIDSSSKSNPLHRRWKNTMRRRRRRHCRQKNV